MSTAPSEQAAPLPYTFATWVFQLHVGGVRADDPEVAAACDAIAAAGDRAAGDAAGQRLGERLRALLGDGTDPAGAARRLYGDRVATDMGQGDRQERTHRIRKYQFARQLPWLARIWERTDGAVQPTWLLVERVTDEVTAMDPNPWNDVDEERHLPVSDFHVLWELDACSNVYLT